MKRTHITIAVAALVVFASLALMAVPAAGRTAVRAQQGMELIYDSLDAILRELQSYDFAAGVGAPMRLRAYVFVHKDNAQARKETEAALLEFIQGSPAPGGLMAACRALRLVGGPDSVPVLAALALKPETTDAARYALERIPGEEADRALVEGLGKTAGAIKRGIVFSLGERKTAAAVPALAGLAAGKDTALAMDAVKALGKIGGAEAVKTLTAMLGKAGASAQVRGRIGPASRGRRIARSRRQGLRPRRFTIRSSRPISPRFPGRPRSRASSPPRTTLGP